MSGTANSSVVRPDLLVVGFVYLELFMPRELLAPSPGEEIFVDDLSLGVGGALNAASVARALGVPTTLSFPLPIGPFANVAQEAAEQLHLDCRPWPTSVAPPISVVFSRHQERAFLSSASFEAFDECPSLLPPSSWILVAGLREAMRIEGQLASAQAEGARVCVNACWAPDELDRLLTQHEPPWDLLVVNEKEAARATGRVEGPLAELARVVPAVVVTSGEHGARALLEGKWLEVPAAKAPQVVDTTGTGDAFCAGLLTARLRGASAKESLRHASEVAARVLSIRGGAVSDPSLFDGLTVSC